MHNASLKFRTVSQGNAPLPAQSSPSRPSPSRFAASLTLAAMSLGYGVVQLVRSWFKTDWPYFLRLADELISFFSTGMFTSERRLI